MNEVDNILHVGQVSSVDLKTASCRVAYDDLDGHVSADLQILYPALGMWRVFYVPKPSDHVTVLRSPNGNEEGFLLGTRYTATNMPGSAEEGQIILVSNDSETIIALDAKTGAVSVKCKDVSINAAGETVIDSKGILIEATEEIIVTSPKIKLSAKDFIIETDLLTVEGNLFVNGDVENTGDMKTIGQHVDGIGIHS